MFSRSPALRSSNWARVSCEFVTTFKAFCCGVGAKPILVRDFIHSALYDKHHGFFSRGLKPIGVLKRSINFNQLNGREDYINYLDKIYKENDVSWFTPVELFKPWYAYGIAEAIMRTADLSIPLKIYEIGGGSGTCAKNIMDYIMLYAPSRVYNNMIYTSIEISPSLAQFQQETVGKSPSHKMKFRVECRDAADQSGWRNVEDTPCWVIILEVLDNLPHDLVYSENQASPWKEVWVQKQPDNEAHSELYVPVQDSLVSVCIKLMNLDNDDSLSSMRSFWSRVFPRPRRLWLPTGCLKLLEVLHGALPKMSIIASDFSYLPDVNVPGEWAPLVSTKKNGCTIDHTNYLEAKGDTDIFFPINFGLLEMMDHYCSECRNVQRHKSNKQGKKRRVLVLSTSAFMEEFALSNKTRTMDGFNPLMDDFKNTKFYLSVPTHNVS